MKHILLESMFFADFVIRLWIEQPPDRGERSVLIIESIATNTGEIRHKKYSLVTFFQRLLQNEIRSAQKSGDDFYLDLYNVNHNPLSGEKLGKDQIKEKLREYADK